MSMEAEWPDQLPSYRGYVVWPVNSKLFGHGVQVFRWTFIGEKFKLKDDGTVIGYLRNCLIEVPDDASQDVHDQLNRYHISRAEGKVDKHRKCIYMEETKEKTEDTFLKPPLNEYRIDPDTWQLKLSSDNKIMIGCEPSDDTEEQKTKVVGQGLLIAYPYYGENICPDLSPTTKHEKLLKISKFVAKNEERIYTGGRRIVYHQVEYKQLYNVNTVDETFNAQVSVTLFWQLTKVELFRLMMEGSDMFQPNWVPPTLEFTNALDMDDDETGAISLVTINKSFWAARQTHIRSTFQETLELENFPFDRQLFTIEISLAGECDVEWELKPHPDKHIAKYESDWLNDFVLDENFHTVETRLTENSITDNQFAMIKKKVAHKLEIVMSGERIYKVYLVRVSGILALFVLVTMSAFTLDPLDDVGDSLAIVLTTMLAAVAYTLVLDEDLPSLGYITRIEKHVLISYMFIFIVAAQVSLIPYLPDPYSARIYCVIIDVVLFFVFVIIETITLVSCIIPFEKERKYTITEQHKKKPAPFSQYMPLRASRDSFLEGSITH